MGKTAENERIKYAATWYNNVSVTLIVAGFVLPYFALAPKFHLLWMRMTNQEFYITDEMDWMNANWPYSLAAMALSLLASFWCRRRADKLLKRLQD